MCGEFYSSQGIRLKVNVALDAHIGSIETGSVNGHVDIGSPCFVLPFDVQAFVGTQVGCQAAVIGKTTLPLQGNVTPAVERRSKTVVPVNFLRDGNFLIIGRGGKLDVGLVIVVRDDNIAIVIFQIHTWRDGNSLTIFLVESLGDF
jgi:hypothetical protein